MQLADLALGQRDEADAGEAELLVERCDVLLVAGQAVERLGDHDLEGAGTRVLQQLLVAGPKAARAAHAVIRIGRDRRPAFRRDPGCAEPHLVLDRGVALKVGRIPGIDGGTQGHRRTFLLRAVRFSRCVVAASMALARLYARSVVLKSALLLIVAPTLTCCGALIAKVVGATSRNMCRFIGLPKRFAVREPTVRLIV